MGVSGVGWVDDEASCSTCNVVIVVDGRTKVNGWTWEGCGLSRGQVAYAEGIGDDDG